MVRGRELLGLSFGTDSNVYGPAEDTELLLEAVEIERPTLGDRVAEIGCGHGLGAIACARAGAQVVASDSNPHACRAALRNARANGADIGVVRADLLSFTRNRFDLILFNAPYLPREGRLFDWAEAALTGGDRGDESIKRFMEQIRSHLLPDGRALVVASTRTGNEWIAEATNQGFSVSTVATRKVPHEILSAHKLSAKSAATRNP